MRNKNEWEMSESFHIQGPQRISGVYRPQGNKNEALPLLCAALLGRSAVTISNVPNIVDVENLLKIIAGVGADVAYHDHEVRLHPPEILDSRPDPELSARIRASLLLAPPLLVRTGKFVLNRPGGDAIGRRRIDSHLLVFQAFGARISREKDSLIITLPKQYPGAEIHLDETSVMATENALMLAAATQEHTVIHNAAMEPHVQQLAGFLISGGARITGLGSNHLEITGSPELNFQSHRLLEDHIEVGSLIALAAAQRSPLTISDVAPENYFAIRRAFNRLGVDFYFQGKKLLVPAEQSLKVVPEADGQTPRLHDSPWPGFPPDLTSILTVLATQAEGPVLIHEWMFESRLFWVDSLISMGARVVLCDPHRAVVFGSSPLHGAVLSSPDIRAGMALLIAALTARGTTEIRNITQIDRGYEAIDQRLNALGADIRRCPTGKNLEHCHEKGN